MKKTYETPKAEKYIFNYAENVTASNTIDYEQYKNVKHYPDLNPCYTHNTSDLMVPFATTCILNAIIK